MKTANQLAFTTCEASLKLNLSDPIRIISDNIDWSFTYSFFVTSISSKTLPMVPSPISVTAWEKIFSTKCCID